MARSRTFACTSRYSAFLYFTAGRTQSESVDGCARFILYLNALSIVETKIEQQALTFWSGYAVLNGSLLILTVVLFIRRTWMTRWLPSWCSAWRLREMLAHRSKGGEA